jgi:hypothetical protein
MGISSQLVKYFDQNFQFDFATEHLPVLGALPHFAFGLIPCQFRTAHSTSWSLLCKIAQAIGRL